MVWCDGLQVLEFDFDDGDGPGRLETGSEQQGGARKKRKKPRDLRGGAQVVDSLLLLLKRVGEQTSRAGASWLWRGQDGAWAAALLQSAFRALLANNTFRFETHDLTFFYSDAASASTYREEIQDYRKAGQNKKTKNQNRRQK